MTLKRINMSPILSDGLLDSLLGKVSDLNSRLAPIESTYALTQAQTEGTLGEVRVALEGLNAVQSQMLDLAAFITDQSLSVLFVNSSVHANYPPFSVRARGIEDRLATIAIGPVAVDYGTAPNTATGDTIAVALGKLNAPLAAGGFDPLIDFAAPDDVATAVRKLEAALDRAEDVYSPPVGPIGPVANTIQNTPASSTLAVSQISNAVPIINNIDARLTALGV